MHTTVLTQEISFSFPVIYTFRVTV